MRFSNKHKAILICYVGPLLLAFALLYMYNCAVDEQPEVGTAIGVQNVYASGISDEAKELIDDLWWKHHGYTITDNILTYDPLNNWTWSMTFDNGILTIETQDGTWFTEMEKMEEENKSEN